MKVFVDTSALVALSDAGDTLHSQARKVADALPTGTRFVTTVHVLDEALTLVRRRVHHRRAVELGQAVLASALFEVVHPGEQATGQAMELFGRFSDVPLSFTDCLSFVAMRARGLAHAFAFDEHFRMFGFELCGGTG